MSCFGGIPKTRWPIPDALIGLTHGSIVRTTYAESLEYSRAAIVPTAEEFHFAFEASGRVTTRQLAGGVRGSGLAEPPWRATQHSSSAISGVGIGLPHSISPMEDDGQERRVAVEVSAPNKKEQCSPCPISLTWRRLGRRFPLIPRA